MTVPLQRMHRAQFKLGMTTICFNTLLILNVFLGITCGQAAGKSLQLGESTQAFRSATVPALVVIFDGQSAETDAQPNFKIIPPPGQELGALPLNPIKNHFVFGGWFTAKDGNGPEITATTVVAGNLTAYAKWIPESTVKVGNLLWKKCSEGQNDDGVCSGNAYKHQLCSYMLNHTNCPDLSFPSPVTAGPAFDRCNALNTTPSGGFAGKTNWRLPTLTELQSLANSFPASKFPNTVNGIYWSSNWALGGITPASGMVAFSANAEYASDIDSFTLGHPTDFFYLRCVANDP